jgi:peroxiredoxin
MKNWYLSAMFMVAGLGLTLSAQSASAQAAKIGAVAPSFELKGQDGKTYKLSDFKDQTVVLEWYNKDCPYVKKHYDSERSNMQTLQKKYADKGVVWFQIISSVPGKQGYETPEEAQATMKSVKSAAKAVLLDIDGKVGLSYDAKTTPHMYVINKNQELVYAGAIDDKPTAKTADIDTAKNYVVEALDAVLDGKKVPTESTKAYGCSVKYN